MAAEKDKKKRVVGVAEINDRPYSLTGMMDET